MTLKRTFDFVLALLLLVPLTPVFLIIAVLIRLESPGTVFYRGLRVGLGGKPFRIFKFRSMVPNADKIGGPSTADGDPRVTRMGRILRKWKLDELPQVLNVLTGDMSFVGPRPEVPMYTALFTPQEKEILSVRPGITDWASLWNSNEGALLAGAPDPEKFYLEQIRPEKIRLQLKYVRERSFGVDWTIIARTAGLVLGRVGKRDSKDASAAKVCHG
jgi:lipopolysaccharide/colanic/teichoic acid biosynthesis glycosyltransferase